MLWMRNATQDVRGKVIGVLEGPFLRDFTLDLTIEKINQIKEHKPKIPASAQSWRYESCA